MILLGALAALALSAVTTAAASAHEFLVEGTAITANVEGAVTSGTSTLSSTIKSKKIQIVSKLGTGTFILETGGKSRYTVTFTNTIVYEQESSGHLKNLGCIAGTSGQIRFSGTGLLEEPGTELLDKFEGSAPPLFVKLSLSECTLEGIYEAKGTASAETPENAVSRAVHELIFQPAQESLTLGAEPAVFTSTESLSLCSSQNWSAK
jgi:hypothetical protein